MASTPGTWDGTLLRTRADGRQEVADTREANSQYGCRRDPWCILRDQHDGPCDEDRETAPDHPDTPTS